jgi:hypothetical protein
MAGMSLRIVNLANCSGVGAADAGWIMQDLASACPRVLDLTGPHRMDQQAPDRTSLLVDHAGCLCRFQCHILRVSSQAGS